MTRKPFPGFSVHDCHREGPSDRDETPAGVFGFVFRGQGTISGTWGLTGWTGFGSVLAEPSRAEPSRAEPSRAEPSRAEPSRAEPSRAEPSRAEPSRAEPSRAEPSRAEPSRAEPSPSRAEPSRAEPSRAEPSRAEPSRIIIYPQRAADAMGRARIARRGRDSRPSTGPAHALTPGRRRPAVAASLSRFPHLHLTRPGASLAACLFALVLLLGPADVWATGECTSTPDTGKWIKCEEDSTSTSDIIIDASGIDLDPTGEHESGVHAIHAGSGNIDIDISGSESGGVTTASTIDTSDSYTDGIYTQHTGTTTGTIDDHGGRYRNHDHVRDWKKRVGRRGIFAQNQAKGDITIDLDPGTVINSVSHGVFTNHSNSAASDATYTGSDIILNADEVIITSGGHAFRALRESGPGDISIGITDSTFTAGTTGSNSIIGIYATRYANSGDDGDITITVTNGSTTTKGHVGHGINAYPADG